MQRGGVTYIISNEPRTVFYTGVTNNILNRMNQHRDEVGSEFTSKYKLKFLMHYEFYSRIEEAIAREKQLKRWHRQWKINLIRKNNPMMEDLYERLLQEDQAVTNRKPEGKTDPETSSG